MADPVQGALTLARLQIEVDEKILGLKDCQCRQCKLARVVIAVAALAEDWDGPDEYETINRRHVANTIRELVGVPPVESSER